MGDGVVLDGPFSLPLAFTHNRKLSACRTPQSNQVGTLPGKRPPSGEYLGTLGDLKSRWVGTGTHRHTCLLAKEVQDSGIWRANALKKLPPPPIP